MGGKKRDIKKKMRTIQNHYVKQKIHWTEEIASRKKTEAAEVMNNDKVWKKEVKLHTGDEGNENITWEAREVVEITGRVKERVVEEDDTA